MKNQPLFSKREREVVALLLQGKSNKQIAASLGVSENTVEYHLKKIYFKLEVNSRTEAVLKLGKSVGGIFDLSRDSVVEIKGKRVDNSDKPISPRRLPMKKTTIIGGGLLIATAVMLIVSCYLFVMARSKNLLTDEIPIAAEENSTAVKIVTFVSGDWTNYIAPEWKQQEEAIAISSIAIAADKTLWIGTTGGVASVGTGVYRFDGKSWARYTSSNSGLPANEVSSILSTPDGTIWFTTFCCGVARFDGKTWTTYTVNNGLASNDVRSSALALDGSIWLGTADKGASRFDGKVWTTYSQDNGLAGNFVGHIVSFPDGSLAFSASDDAWANVNLFDGKEWVVFPMPDEITKTYVFDIAAGSDGSLWFATEKNGVYRLTDNAWANYTTRDNLPSDTVSCVAVAPDNSVWIGTIQGISKFDGVDWMIVLTPDDKVGCPIAVEANGTIWFGGASAIYRYQPLK